MQRYKYADAACPWLDDEPDENFGDDLLRCWDGSSCNPAVAGWDCCTCRGGRAYCPSKTPYFCDDVSCGSGTAWCCMEKCPQEGVADALGHTRPCPSRHPAYLPAQWQCSGPPHVPPLPPMPPMPPLLPRPPGHPSPSTPPPSPSRPPPSPTQPPPSPPVSNASTIAGPTLATVILGGASISLLLALLALLAVAWRWLSSGGMRRRRGRIDATKHVAAQEAALQVTSAIPESHASCTVGPAHDLAPHHPRLRAPLSGSWLSVVCLRAPTRHVAAERQRRRWHQVRRLPRGRRRQRRRQRRWRWHRPRRNAPSASATLSRATCCGRCAAAIASIARASTSGSSARAAPTPRRACPPARCARRQRSPRTSGRRAVAPRSRCGGSRHEDCRRIHLTGSAGDSVENPERRFRPKASGTFAEKS